MRDREERGEEGGLKEHCYCYRESIDMGQARAGVVVSPETSRWGGIGMQQTESTRATPNVSCLDVITESSAGERTS